MPTSVFLAWTLVVQVQLHLCQDGVCQPHPKLQEKSQVVRTFDSESACLLTQMDLQRAYQKTHQPVAKPKPSRRQVEAKATFVCQPSH
jgi:hypothetical protein